MVILLPSNIHVFTLNFFSLVLYDSNYVRFGWHEKDDLITTISYLYRKMFFVVTSLLYGVKDQLIARMVLDSPFSNMFDLMMEFVDLPSQVQGHNTIQKKPRATSSVLEEKVLVLDHICRQTQQVDKKEFQYQSKTFVIVVV